MPSKKKKYNARFPPARIKKIMQTDEEIGKVAAAVPVIICILPAKYLHCKFQGCDHLTQTCCIIISFTETSARALELFLESLLTKACQVTQSRNAKTMTTSHLKQCIELEQQFDFLKDLVATVPDMQGEGEENHTEVGAEKVPRRLTTKRRRKAERAHFFSSSKREGSKTRVWPQEWRGWHQRQGQEVVRHRVRARG
ncbi:dr1-associated corepressor isoform X7 [Siniperca chuatsi]|uniref:dr1-associated corepressor isoform X6 n=1 Tax=Siniperca chuatsi TaxID=119488 RepID=UPI001CE0F2FE|nr:dr1-associated corepressor isoform X6 [Siniperca chuatsi]XP_044040875.1 dr1-associated corepressor isoform X7 [Siniperca chuatsi]